VFYKKVSFILVCVNLSIKYTMQYYFQIFKTFYLWPTIQIKIFQLKFNILMLTWNIFYFFTFNALSLLTAINFKLLSISRETETLFKVKWGDWHSLTKTNIRRFLFHYFPKFHNNQHILFEAPFLFNSLSLIATDVFFFIVQ
jgi:hypothetical protein